MSHSFLDLGLTPQLCQQLTSIGFLQPTEIQTKAIPVALQFNNMVAVAQTGTGKTAAYALPLLHRLSLRLNDDQVGPFALIVVPTRELAQQVHDDIQTYIGEQAIRLGVIYGGTSYRMQTKQQLNQLDILVATPGRLLDHLHQGNVSLAHTSALVLDEGDRLLDLGFLPDISRIIKKMPNREQTCLFSATFDEKLTRVTQQWVENGVRIEVTPANTSAQTVTQKVIQVDKANKPALLAYLIGRSRWQQVLVFTKTKQACETLVKSLKLDGIKATFINGDKSQGARIKALDDFKEGKVRALIATDVAARGIDIPKLDAVINFELPFKPEDYIHRIGRTGRAGESGVALSLVAQDEDVRLFEIETLLDSKLPVEWVSGFEPGQAKPDMVEENDQRRTQNKVKPLTRAEEKRRLKARLLKQAKKK